MSSASSSRSIRKLDMQQAATMLVGLGVRTSTDLGRLNSEKRRPVEIPARPDLYYKDTFTNWKDFFKLGEEGLKKGVVIETCPTYIQLRQLVFQKGISSKQDFRNAISDGRLPAVTPPMPDQYYAEWTDWKDFLAPKQFYVSFNEARKIVRTLGLKNAYQWRQYCRTGLLAEYIPTSPDREYDEFVSWEDFLIGDISE